MTGGTLIMTVSVSTQYKKTYLYWVATKLTMEKKVTLLLTREKFLSKQYDLLNLKKTFTMPWTFLFHKH